MDPPALKSKPELPHYLLFYASSFWLLSGRRSMGFSSANPISFTDMVGYLQLYPWHDVDEFVKVISLMDSQYLEHHRGREKVDLTSSN